MGHHTFIHLSNRTEQLYSALKECLFGETRPFTKRIVTVPSSAMKSWLSLQLAQDPDLGIAAGIEIGFLEPTVRRLHSLLVSNEAKSPDSYEPTELELALALEETLGRIAAQALNCEKNLSRDWEPLLLYLGIPLSGEKTVLSQKILNCIRALAAVLAKTFREYGTYGEKLIAGWKQKESNQSSLGIGWQALLWQEMEQVFACWHYPLQKLESFQMREAVDDDIQIHLFGLSFLPPAYFRFPQKIAAHIPVNYYLLSPCQKFWGDILSDKERLRVADYWEEKKASQASVQALEDFLSDRNSLLANFGRLGREMALQIELTDPQTSEIYALPASSFAVPAYRDLIASDVAFEETGRPLTLLEAIQTDIALLRTPEDNNKIVFDGYDETIQVHAVPKKMREIEVVYNALLNIIDKHANDPSPILPGDIFVMVPDISEYASFIRSVFESSESCLAVQLSDIQTPSCYVMIQGFLHLLSLCCGRWEASSLLQLFDYPAFRARHRLSGEDVSIIRRWIEDAGICWGKDKQHRADVLMLRYGSAAETEESSVGTWEYGLGRLLEGLALSPTAGHDEERNPAGCPEISQGELLGMLIRLVRSLQSDLKPLADGRKLSLSDWSAYLLCLFDAYFQPCCSEDFEGLKILSGHIAAFEAASSRLSNHSYSFETIHRHLKRLLKEGSASYKESNLHAVRFSSLLPMRAVPAKVVVLMGMEDGNYPRRNHEDSLNLLQHKPAGDYFPSRTDFDRSLFLESLLSARRYLIISYVCQEPGESKSRSPSLLVKELTHYLDQAYSIKSDGEKSKPSDFCLYRHPLNPFHHSYFSEGSRCKSFSFSSYLAALSHYGREKSPVHSFLQGFFPKASEIRDESQEISIVLKDLLAFSKNPLKVYLRNAFKIYIERDEERKIKDEEDLFLSNLHASLLVKEGVFRPKEPVLKKAEKTGQMPPGPFRKVEEKRVSDEIAQCVDYLESLGIQKKGVLPLEFNDRHVKPERDSEGWKIPAIPISVPGSGIIKVSGRLEWVCEQGIILPFRYEDQKLVEIWPSCLILRWLIETYQLPIAPQAIFIRGKPGIFKIGQGAKAADAAGALEEYLRYYLNYRKEPSPLMPEWIPGLLDDPGGLKNPFKKKPDEEFRQHFDPYIKWLKRNSTHAELESTAHHWQSLARSLFAGAFEEKNKRKLGQRQEEAHDFV